ncbi:MAG: acyl-CoA dehydrogenase C-terminal domain-containing protein [Gammaproteobacteria bacterium]|nr:acyl-CoA dehydrogenase C-terminal domain-containing protein [Gammaproteobacteria bacterium]MBU1861405.1 acyl-CoA dehydrogenase C-terminal domain-containing protein [Gammaproteobacteria bacterium]
MSYQAPLRDMRFVLHELFDISSHCELLGNGLDRELIDGVLEEGARYTAEVVAPLNRNSDEQGCQLSDGQVTTPDGFAEAYQQYVDNGWASMTGPSEYGGQALPQMLACNFHEMLMSASLSFRVYSGLTEGAVLALYKHGSDALKSAYLEKLVSGQWAGTMCLTEPQAGTDLALLRSKAEPQADGSFKVSGSKIFISGGEQDLSENIIHLVLARLPDAPAGVKGISLLLVPKFIVAADGMPGERNALSCGAIEHKMGIKGASTCVMNFDGATGWLVGDANQGLACMFTMMNDARFQVGLQGLGIGEAAFQGALRYARERLQSRALSGPAEPSKAADPIIVHPDVRRMLLTQKSLVEGSRMLAAYCARQLDLEHGHPDAAARKSAGKRAALLIPIIKAFFTDMGQEVASHAVQVYGGHGFIREWGIEQLMRDSRITQLYEGTNGIQALDYMRRKVLGDGGAELSALQAEFSELCDAQAGRPALAALAKSVQARLGEWRELSSEVIAASQRDVQEIGAMSVDFLQYSAYVLLAGFWLQAAVRAQDALEAGSGEAAFYQAKLQAADFYLRRVLPRASAHREALLGGAACLMAMDEASFAF